MEKGGRRRASEEDVPYRRKEQREAMLLALKMEQGPLPKGCGWPLEAREGREADFPLELPERKLALPSP